MLFNANTIENSTLNIKIFNKQSFELSTYIYRFQQIQLAIRKYFCNEEDFVCDDKLISDQYFIFSRFEYIAFVFYLTTMLMLY